MKYNANALRHPKTQWELEAAMHRAIDHGAAIACTVAGHEIVSIIHDRKAVPAFSFWQDGQDVSDEFRKVLRAI
jgi:hypothetical protein